MRNELTDLLHDMLRMEPHTLDIHGQWRTDLPTFGGEEPEDTHDVWSWDETHLIVGTCVGDLWTVDRDEHPVQDNEEPDGEPSRDVFDPTLADAAEDRWRAS
jgi:hypothetical protein